MTAAIGPDYGFGLYVHWPYCTRICPYCDFNVYAAKDRDRAPLVAAIIADIRAHGARLPEHKTLQSIFFGGGTPSLLSAAEMSRIIEASNDTFDLAQGIEITLESNPNDVLRDNPDDWLNAGINRLSLGVQSLQDEALTFLGRDHDSNAARRAVDRALATFDNLSIDMIYARPGQSPDTWAIELSRALDLGAPHVSLYELTIEARTAFGKRAARGELTPMPDDDQADLYELTQAICAERDLTAYEVSNHARGSEFESRHNHTYWASGDWIGVGPGAHGRLTIDGLRLATEAARRPEDYVSATGPVETRLTQLDTAREFLAMALRPVSGLDLARFERLFGQAPDTELLAQLKHQGLAHVDENQLTLTSQGRLMADYIAGQLSPY
ncbi:MAG: radical SAM family heme chaperone HemW [Pseudomonadota bacterium]